ncbi:MAG: hypothetical protein RLY21_2239 [Planctomycetota bacterium]
MLREDDWFDAPLAQRARRASRIALACYLVPVMVATHWPRLAFQGAGTVDKFVHFVGFGLLTWLFLNASLFRRPILNFALAVFWVYFDEFTQAIEILGRTFSGYDMIAGWLGCAVAGVIWWGIRLRAPRGTEERLDDLTAERLVYGTSRGWLSVAIAVAGFMGLFVGSMLFVSWYSTGELLGFGGIVFPGGLGFLIGVAFGGVGAYIRANARVASGRIDAWTGTVESEGAPFRHRDYAPAIRVPLVVGALLAIPAGWAVVGIEYLLFGEVTDEKLVDSAGFVVLRPIFGAMLAFAGAIVAASVMVRLRRAKRGFHAQRLRP